MSEYDKDRVILKKILGYCNDIDDAVNRFGGSLEIFRGDTAYRNACALCILQIGELCNALSLGFSKAHPEMPWNQIRGMRNVVAHAYGTISVQTAWDTIQQDIPELKSFCIKTLDNYEEEAK